MTTPAVTVLVPDSGGVIVTLAPEGVTFDGPRKAVAEAALGSLTERSPAWHGTVTAWIELHRRHGHDAVAALVRAGYEDPDDLVAWFDSGRIQADLQPFLRSPAFSVYREGTPLAEIAEWIERGFTDPEVVAHWLYNELTPERAERWNDDLLDYFYAECFSLAEAEAWAAAGVDSDRAAGFGWLEVEEALPWVLAGFSGEEAEAAYDAGFDDPSDPGAAVFRHGPIPNAKELATPPTPMPEQDQAARAAFDQALSKGLEAEDYLPSILEAAYDAGLDALTPKSGTVDGRLAHGALPAGWWPDGRFERDEAGSPFDDGTTVERVWELVDTVFCDAEVLISCDYTGLSMTSGGAAGVNAFRFGDAVYTYDWNEDGMYDSFHVSFSYRYGDAAGRQQMFVNAARGDIAYGYGYVQTYLAVDAPDKMRDVLAQEAAQYDHCPWDTDLLYREIGDLDDEDLRELADDLAGELRVTVKSARRILRRLREGMVETANERKVAWWVVRDAL